MTDQWTRILTPDELEAHYAKEAIRYPSFTRLVRHHLEHSSVEKLNAYAADALYTNYAEGYQLARSHAALAAGAAGAEEAATATKKAWAKAAIEALEEAQAALLDETPEDGMSKADAIADTLEKIRLVLNQPTK